MTTEAGFFYGAHDGCTEYQHHRHPLSGEQPREYDIEVHATITFRVSVDTDGTVRVRDAGYVVSKNAIDAADPRMPYTGKIAEVEDAEFEAMCDAIVAIRDGEIPTHDRWPEHRQPVLDEAVEA